MRHPIIVTLEDHLAALKEKGITEANLQLGYPAGTIDKEVTRVFNESVQEAKQTNEDAYFKLGLRGKPPGQVTPMGVSLLYRVTKQGAMLLRGVVVKLDQAQKILLAPDPRDLKLINAIYEELFRANKHKKAKAIQQQPVTPSPQKKLHV